jgi:hypothetical protein
VHFPIARLILAPVLNRTRGVTTYGETTDRTIKIDPRAPHPAMTLLHEYLHVLHPGWSETRVRKEERRRWKRLTWRDKARLYQRLGRARIENGEDA